MIVASLVGVTEAGAALLACHAACASLRWFGIGSSVVAIGARIRRRGLGVAPSAVSNVSSMSALLPSLLLPWASVELVSISLSSPSMSASSAPSLPLALAVKSSTELAFVSSPEG